MLPEDAQISKWCQYYSKASIILNVLTEYTLMTSSQTLEQRLKLLQSIDLDEPLKEPTCQIFCMVERICHDCGWKKENHGNLHGWSWKDCHKVCRWSSFQRGSASAFWTSASIQQWLVLRIESQHWADLGCAGDERAWEHSHCLACNGWCLASIPKPRLRDLWQSVLHIEASFQGQEFATNQILVCWQIPRKRSHPQLQMPSWENSPPEALEECQY